MLPRRLLPAAAALALGLTASSTAALVAAATDELVPEALRSGARSLARSLAEVGLSDETERVADILRRLGEPEWMIEKQRRSWERASAKPAGDRAAVSAAARELARNLGKRLAAEKDSERREALARIALELDAQDPDANALLGNVLYVDRWVSPERALFEERRDRVEDLVREASEYRIAIEHLEPAPPPEDAQRPSRPEHLLRALYGDPGNGVRAHGIALHAPDSVARLERMLLATLRATALSHALLVGELGMPEPMGRRQFVLVDSLVVLRRAVDEAVESGGLTEVERREILSNNVRSFYDRRGWRTSFWDFDGSFQAILLWEVSEAWLGDAVQPCLLAGHLNWLSLRLFGNPLPHLAWIDQSAPTQTVAVGSPRWKQDMRWRAARRTLYGCRSWLQEQVRSGADPPWPRAMLDRVGKIQNELLIKTTSVVEFLQERGDFGRILFESNGKAPGIEAMRLVLEAEIPDVEAEWRAWLLVEETQAGLVQRLAAGPRASSAMADAVLAELNAVRERVLGEQVDGLGPVEIEPQLSDWAAAHARYLGLHVDQHVSWPDMHQEYSSRRGFTPEGARSATRSVIDFTEDPARSVASWMGTFYHRLPLLEPGLFAVGFAYEGGISVLDARSLVADVRQELWITWPPDGAVDVPLRFQDELPPPVPGRATTELGYPLTLQVWRPDAAEWLDVRLELRRGEELVESLTSSPSEPTNPRCAPPDAWALIPLEPLAPSTRYRFVIESNERSFEVAFTTQSGE